MSQFFLTRKFSDFRFVILHSLNRILNTEVSHSLSDRVIHLHPRLFDDISTEWADNDIFLLGGRMERRRS